MSRLPAALTLLVAPLAIACSGDNAQQTSDTPPATMEPSATATPVLPPNATGLPPPLGAPLGTTCQVESPPPDRKTVRPNGADVGVGYDPFCIAWTDVFTDEMGFRVELRYGSDPIVYNVPANTNEVYPPPEDWPLAHGIGDVTVTVFALTPDGERIVEGFALDVN